MKELLNVALDAVKQAETIILHYHGKDLQEEIKQDMSPVTIADKEAEAIIKKTIRRHFPDHTFYGEEGEKTNLEAHKGYTWIIDPIDGTKCYTRSSRLFATQLALMHDGELVLGVSNAPLMNELVYAQKGHGCFFNGAKVSVSVANSIQDAYLSYGSLKYFSKNNQFEQLLTLSSSVKWSRGIGDFWSYHLLAQGHIDIMIESETKLWDIAALSVIVTEAGGKISQMDGQPINHNTTDVIATNGLIHEDIIRIFNNDNTEEKS